MLTSAAAPKATPAPTPPPAVAASTKAPAAAAPAPVAAGEASNSAKLTFTLSFYPGVPAREIATDIKHGVYTIGHMNNVQTQVELLKGTQHLFPHYTLLGSYTGNVDDVKAAGARMGEWYKKVVNSSCRSGTGSTAMHPASAA